MTLTRTRRVLVAGVAAVVVGLVGVVPAHAAPDGPTATQVGTYAYLTSPNYDGLAPIGAVSAGLTVGLGTFAALDGELVLVGGTVYHVGIDGVPTIAPAAKRTAFFQGVRFKPARSVAVAPGTTCADLPAIVTRTARTQTGMVAVRVRGTFTDLVTRSVPAQSKPYPPLADVVAKQTEFRLGQRRAVLVGFWSGSDFLGVGAPGLHLHGVTADRTAGGHVLSCVAGSDVQLSVEPLASVDVSGYQP